MPNVVLTNPQFREILGQHAITVVAPASGTTFEKMEQLQALGELNIHVPTDIMHDVIPYHANSDELRFEQLKQALYDDSNAIIWALRGGYGSARLIEQLRVLPKPEREKIFIGFSDITALHLFLSQQWQWRTIHGSGLSQILDPMQDPQNFLRIAEIVAHTSSPQTFSGLRPLNHAAKTAQTIKGCLTGGNLTLVETSIGTSWQMQSTDSIVFLEEVGEKGYRIDRSLNHLYQAGLFNDVKAILLGDFANPADEENVTIALERFANEMNMPVFKTDQFGHGDKNYPLIYNTMSEITPVKHQSYALNIFASVKI